VGKYSEVVTRRTMGGGRGELAAKGSASATRKPKATINPATANTPIIQKAFCLVNINFTSQGYG
jgi:hypothetical protein